MNSFAIQPAFGPIILKLLTWLIFILLGFSIFKLLAKAYFIKLNNKTYEIKLLPFFLIKIFDKINSNYFEESKKEFKILNRKKEEIGKLKRYLFRGVQIELSDYCKFIGEKEEIRHIKLTKDDNVSINDKNNEILVLKKITKSDYYDI